MFTESIQKNPEMEDMDLESSANADSNIDYSSFIKLWQLPESSDYLEHLYGSFISLDSFSNSSQSLPPSPISHDLPKEDTNND